MNREMTLRALEDVAQRRAGLEADLAGLDERRDAGATERARNLRTGLANLAREQARLEQQLAAFDRLAAEGPDGPSFERGDDTGTTLHRQREQPTGGPVQRDAIQLLGRARQLGDELSERLGRLVEADPTPLTAGWVRSAADPAYATAWGKVARDPMNGHRAFTTGELEAWQRAEHEARALNLTTGAAMVPTHLDPTIMLSSDGSVDPMREVARVVTLTVGSTWHGVSSEGVVAEWLAEEAEAADASPTLTDPEVPTHKAAAFVPLSYEALDDMADVNSELRELFLDAKAQHEAPAFLSGSGTGQPQGLVTGLAAGQTVETATAGTFASGDVYALIAALPPRFRDRARWLAALEIINTLDQMETGNGAKLFDRVGDAEPVLLRRRLHEHSNMSGTIAAGEHVLAVGDLRRAYVIADRAGFALELIPHLFGANRRPTGQRGWFAHWRVGGNVVVPNAARRLAVAAV